MRNDFCKCLEKTSKRMKARRFKNVVNYVNMDSYSNTVNRVLPSILAAPSAIWSIEWVLRSGYSTTISHEWKHYLLRFRTIFLLTTHSQYAIVLPLDASLAVRVNHPTILWPDFEERVDDVRSLKKFHVTKSGCPIRAYMYSFGSRLWCTIKLRFNRKRTVGSLAPLDRLWHNTTRFAWMQSCGNQDVLRNIVVKDNRTTRADAFVISLVTQVTYSMMLTYPLARNVLVS